jgi:hypothetical protein
VFVLLCVVAACVTIFTSDPERRKIGYRIFRDLLQCFHRGQGK